MKEEMDFIALCSSLALIGFVYFTIHLYKTIVLDSQIVRKKIRSQGINGPAPSFLYGNLSEMQQIKLKATEAARNFGPDLCSLAASDYTSTIFPYYDNWRQKYGLVYTYSTGFKQHLYINDPELVKELNQSVTLDLGKPPYVTRRYKPVFGNGIVGSNGPAWAHQRKIIAPEFFIDKVKRMVGLMVESTQPLLNKWEEEIEAKGGLEAEINVFEDLKGQSANVIARACFGSFYSKGKDIFSKLCSLQNALAQENLLSKITSFGFYPKRNKISNLEREVESLIWETVKERERQYSETRSTEKDLMQSILEEAVNDTTSLNTAKISPKNFIVDNCKAIYFSGHDTTATAASWCLMLLSLHPHWQSRIRDEVARFCPDGLPDATSLSNLKMVTMVIQEGLRLYPPSAFTVREALEEIQLGNITVPKGVCMWTLITTLHRDPNIWGPDANEFKPERFADGVSKACKFPQAYIPFGHGTRLCIGRNFAMTQLKVVISLVVSRFSFKLSPNYRHSPAFRMTVQPEYGLQLLVQKA